MKTEFQLRIEQELRQSVSPAKRMDALEKLSNGVDKQHGLFLENMLAGLLFKDDNSVVRHEIAFLLGQLYGLQC